MQYGADRPHSTDRSHFRFCPRCGQELSLLEVDDRPRAVCSRCGFVHYRNPVVGVAGVVCEAFPEGALWWADLPARIGLRQVVSSTPEMLQPLSVVVDQRGLTATNPSGTEQFPWSQFVAYIESDSMMVLGMSLDSPTAVGILKQDAAVGDLTWQAATDRVRANVAVHPRIAHLRTKKGR